MPVQKQVWKLIEGTSLVEESFLYTYLFLQLSLMEVFLNVEKYFSW